MYHQGEEADKQEIAVHSLLIHFRSPAKPTPTLCLLLPLEIPRRVTVDWPACPLRRERLPLPCPDPPATGQQKEPATGQPNALVSRDPVSSTSANVVVSGAAWKKLVHERFLDVLEWINAVVDRWSFKAELDCCCFRRLTQFFGASSVQQRLAC